jgi:hypothetical protein
MPWGRWFIGLGALVVVAALFVIALARQPPDTLGAPDSSTVDTNAALTALAGGVAKSIYRAGFAAPGDGGAATYRWTKPGCTLNGGAGDGGFQVAPRFGGGCWMLAVTPVVDARIWGCAEDGTSDDTACWRAIDAAWGAMPSPPAQVFLAGNSAVAMGQGGADGCLKHIMRISGQLGASQFTIAPGRHGEPLCYSGNGPFELDHVTVSLPLPDWASKTATGVYSILVTGKAPEPHQVSGIRIHDNIITGGNVGVVLQSVADAEIYLNRIVQVGNDGIRVDSSGDTATTTTSDISVHDNACRITGHYCVSLANQRQVTAAPRRLYIYGNTAVGSGIFADKGCYDLTANSYDYLVADNSGVDCAVGGGEAKMTYSAGVGVIPYVERGGFVKMRYLSHFDLGSGFEINTENPTTASPDAHSQFFASIDAAYTPAPPWQPGWLYQLGDTVTNKGGVYLAVVSGISANRGGPGGSEHEIRDGAVAWHRLAAEPTAQGVVAAAAPGGATGAGYIAGDVLKVSAAACDIPPVLQPTQVQSGTILGYRVSFEGHCSAAPVNPVGVTGGSGTGAAANLTLLPIANAFTGARINAVSDSRIEVHVERARDGVFLVPQGSTDQTVRRTIIAIDGTVQDSCLVDGVPGDYWTDTATIVQNGVVSDLTILPHCTALGQNSGAIQIGSTRPIPPWEADRNYFQNALVTNAGGQYIAQCVRTVGCKSGASGGPDGAGFGIADGSDGLTWNRYTVRDVAAIDYRNLRIADGYLINQGVFGSSYALFQRGSAGTFSGEIYGTRLIAGTGGILIREPTTLALGGGASLSISGNPGGTQTSAPIEGDGAAASGSVDIAGMMEITAPTALPAWRNVDGGGIVVRGMIVRGNRSAAPAAPCNYGEAWLNSRPSAAIPFGWTCTAPSTVGSPQNFTAH